MMQKCFRIFFLAVSLLVANISVAKTTGMYYPTDITINNYSSYVVSVSVPVLNYYAKYYSYTTNHIYGMDYNAKQVIIWGPNGDMVFSSYVDNHQVINVTNALVNTYKLGKMIPEVS